MTVDRQQFDDALAMFLDGDPEPEDSALIVAALNDDPALVGELRDLLSLDDRLRQQNAEAFVDAVRISLANVGEEDQFVQMVHQKILASVGGSSVGVESVARPMRLGIGIPWAITLLSIVIAVISWVGPRSDVEVSQQPGTSPGVPEELAGLVNESQGSGSELPRVGPAESGPDSKTSSAPRVAAVLVDAVHSEFAAGAGPQGVLLFNNRYVLESGVAHIRFTSGVDMVLQAPVEFDIHDAMLVTLHNGRVRTLVPDSAHGFSIRAPGVVYKDLGTEFGVAVTGDSSELHVFEGAVDVRKPDGAFVGRQEFGDSVRYANGELSPMPPSSPNAFPAPESIGLLRWQDWHKKVRNDPSLVVFFDFQSAEGRDATLRSSTSSSGAVNGRISGARWVTGRWSGKQALLFDRDDDYVAVDVPGEYSQFSVTAWVNLDRIEFPANALFNSDGYSDRDFHWQLNRSGGQWIGLRGSEPKIGQTYRMERVKVGQWTHVATTIDTLAGTATSYVDGKVAFFRRFPPGKNLIAPGSARIANWYCDVDNSSNPNRALRGRIDEFAIWGRTLSVDELIEHYEAGRPSGLTPSGL